MNDQPDFRERMYERSIDVYMYQGKKNSTWMNLYAIFTGAFFIAFYKLIDVVDVDKVDKSDLPIFLFLILIMGLFTSLCWLGTYHAYHSWLKSYVSTMQMHENILIKSKGEELNFFRLHTLGFSCDIKDKWRGGLSGEKINKVFIFGVVLGWVGLLAFCVYEKFKMEFEYCIFAVVIIIAIIIFLFKNSFKNLKSNGIKEMWMAERQETQRTEESQKTSDGQYKITPPEK